MPHNFLQTQAHTNGDAYTADRNCEKYIFKWKKNPIFLLSEKIWKHIWSCIQQSNTQNTQNANRHRLHYNILHYIGVDLKSTHLLNKMKKVRFGIFLEKWQKKEQKTSFTVVAVKWKEIKTKGDGEGETSTRNIGKNANQKYLKRHETNSILTVFEKRLQSNGWVGMSSAMSPISVGPFVIVRTTTAMPNFSNMNVVMITCTFVMISSLSPDSLFQSMPLHTFFIPFYYSAIELYFFRKYRMKNNTKWWIDKSISPKHTYSRGDWCLGGLVIIIILATRCYLISWLLGKNWFDPIIFTSNIFINSVPLPRNSISKMALS